MVGLPDGQEVAGRIVGWLGSWTDGQKGKIQPNESQWRQYILIAVTTIVPR